MEVDVETLIKMFAGAQITRIKDCGRYLLVETNKGSVELLNEVSYTVISAEVVAKPVDSHAETRKMEKPDEKFVVESESVAEAREAEREHQINEKPYSC